MVQRRQYYQIPTTYYTINPQFSMLKIHYILPLALRVSVLHVLRGPWLNKYVTV